jgi:DNA (cytosine-5)-methyltransferase 1
MAKPQNDRGAEFIPQPPSVSYMPEWYLDERVRGVCNHASRAHIEKDLYRYFYAACYAKAQKTSPVLRDFPKDLIPNHGNALTAIEEGNLFEDRFRVQVSTKPATTVTSHIAKDGHYYIHPDPTQCRSMTVREAARLQTFPDNYLFTGPRTAQYTQVGNAVPPLLANQIAAIVLKLFQDLG